MTHLKNEKKVVLKEQSTSQQLLDFPAGCRGGELVDDVQSCLVVCVAHVHIDARLDTKTQTYTQCGIALLKQTLP